MNKWNAPQSFTIRCIFVNVDIQLCSIYLGSLQHNSSLLLTLFLLLEFEPPDTLPSTRQLEIVLLFIMPTIPPTFSSVPVTEAVTRQLSISEPEVTYPATAPTQLVPLTVPATSRFRWMALMWTSWACMNLILLQKIWVRIMMLYTLVLNRMETMYPW